MSVKTFKVIKAVTDEVKYATADRLEAMYRPQLDNKGINLNTVDKSKLFGAIINGNIKCKDGAVRKLKDIYTEDIAIHLTNLTISRLTALRLDTITLA